MRYLGFLFILLMGMACGQRNTAEDQGIASEGSGVRDSVDTYFSKLTALKQFNGVVLAYQGDEVILHQAYNLQGDTSSTLVTTESQFDIHSVSKLMTHYLLVQLESEGNLSMDQTLDAFIDEFPQGDQITLQMLLDHRSGLPRELTHLEGEEIDLTPTEIIALAKKEPLLFEPGSDAQYSNVGYELLYEIVAQIYGKPFAQCVVDELFVPLHMDHSGVHFYTQDSQITHLAKNHVLKDSKLVKVPNISRDEFRTARLFSTTSDLKKFLDAVSQEPFASALQHQGIIQKDGGSRGIRAQVYRDLNHDFGFVLLANYDEMPFFQAVEDLAKMMKSEPVNYPEEINRKAIEVAESVLENYVGAYTFPDFDGLVLEVAIQDGGLVVLQDGEIIATLQAESPTVFFEDPKSRESFEFVKNEAGSYDARMGWKGIVVGGARKRVE
ncbi:serine hydrolase domain-containing protein [Algoriphagus sp. CAU 1675]|uniref:serine hydrolase domain-containing protein n=1 Tax=Algoriphagus sp. CAU 1675 TaxID=3032597 RepID=UPI0023DB18EB|nr:serine hydrolase domain-containing protein [Algoriphagus sp. CAU 1675]MDF2156691.1 serine hydrolase [Algoriphagus sp. CAU 1675]